MNVLVIHDWPGNVWELENSVHRAAILVTDPVIRKAHLASIIDASPQLDLDVPKTGDELKRIKKVARERSVEDIEKLFVLEALKRNALERDQERRGNRNAACHFQALMKKYEIRVWGTEPDPGESGAD
jgi:DNA-binding NtrC family response regulator